MKLSEKSIEKLFAIAFSIMLFGLFYLVVSSNGLVMGNDPAIHIEKTLTILEFERISLMDIAWYPPLYHILLATFMAFTGTVSTEQILFLVNCLTALINWLLILSVYLVGSKFFSKKVGVFAASLILVCFALYEINFWGGYTTMLSLAFMVLLFLYLALDREAPPNALILFMLAFSLVLSHQLTTLLTVIILVPYFLILILKSRGGYPKTGAVALVAGGLIAFFLWYFQVIFSNLENIIEHVFFNLRESLASVVSLTDFVANFGFVLVFSVAGFYIAFRRCRKERTMNFYLLLLLSFLVPLFFLYSYFFGLYLVPFHRFIYYLLPPIAVLAGVTLSFVVDFVFSSYRNNKKGRKRLLLKVASVCTVGLLVLLLFFRFQVVLGKAGEGVEYYSTSDINAYNAGLWLKQSSPEPAKVVVTAKPGAWFGVFSGKTVILETEPPSVRNPIAETVLDLCYEIEHPLTLVRVYEAKGAISNEKYVSINNFWERVSIFSLEDAYVSFHKNGVKQEQKLSELTREIAFEEHEDFKRLVIRYFDDDIAITEYIFVQDDDYSVKSTWALTSLKSEISDVVFSLITQFDLSFSFEEAYVPGVLNFENPWDNPTRIHEDNEWAIVEFSNENLTANQIGFQDDKNDIVFAFDFEVLPNWGSVGALANRQIDAFRFRFEFAKVEVDEPISVSYSTVAYSKDSFPDAPKIDKSLTNFEFGANFEVEFRNYVYYIEEYEIKFLVYSEERFDRNLLNSGLLQKIFFDGKYVICKIKN